ncbi:hypothetical protein, partial [Mesorhizobium escarrei]|uniref:hypothetical protein n=1 Tax=Mesorhizobium escarrei TaxID=666018 RepID=UPI003F53C497
DLRFLLFVGISVQEPQIHHTRYQQLAGVTLNPKFVIALLQRDTNFEFKATPAYRAACQPSRPISASSFDW